MATELVDLTTLVVEKAIELFAIYVGKECKTSEESLQAKNILACCRIYHKNLEDLKVYLKNNQDTEESKDVMKFLEIDSRDFEQLVEKVKKIDETSAFWNIVKDQRKDLRRLELRMYQHIDTMAFIMLKHIWKDSKCSPVKDFIQDPEAQVFWGKYVGAKAREITISGFANSLQDYVKENYNYPKLEQMQNILASTCDFNNNGVISIFEFARFMDRFGPFQKCFIKAACMCDDMGKSLPWFLPMASRDDVHKSFDAGEYTFCVRLSSDPKKHFVFSYITRSGKKNHIFIENAPLNGGYGFIGMKKKKFEETIPQLLQREDILTENHVRDIENVKKAPQFTEKWKKMVEKSDYHKSETDDAYSYIDPSGYTSNYDDE